MTKIQKVVIGLSVLLLVALIGCTSFQSAFAPMYIDPDVGEYTGEEMTSWFPWTSIWDGDRLMKKMIFLHTATLLELERAAEDEISHVSFLTDSLVLSRKDAVEFRDSVFNPEGAMGLLLPTLLGGTIGGLLIRRPQDTKEIEKLKNGNK